MDFKFCIPILKYLCDPSLSTLLLDDATWWSRGPSFAVEDCWEGLEALFSSDLMLLISFLAFARSSWALFTLAPTVAALEFLTEGRSKGKNKNKMKKWWKSKQREKWLWCLDLIHCSTDQLPASNIVQCT